MLGVVGYGCCSKRCIPTGWTAEDLQVVLKRCAGNAIGWFSELDPTVLVLLLTGALGVHPSEEEAPPVEPAAMARHAPLLVADLLAVTGRPLADYLDAALGRALHRADDGTCRRAPGQASATASRWRSSGAAAGPVRRMTRSGGSDPALRPIPPSTDPEYGQQGGELRG